LLIHPEFTSAIDICILRSLVSATEQQYNLGSGDRVIDSVSRPFVDAHLLYPIATKPVITEFAQLHPVDPSVNANLRFRVAQLKTPFHKGSFLPCVR
jgi:hypothetical protein